MVDEDSYIQGSAQSFDYYSLPTHFTASLSKGWGFRGLHRPTCSAAKYLVPWVLPGRRGAWAPVYKYTWSIGHCANWCTMPVPSPSRSSVAFIPLN